MLNSIDQDGTGNGLDFKALKVDSLLVFPPVIFIVFFMFSLRIYFLCLLLKTITNDSSISHILIPTIYGNEKSSIRHVYDTFKFVSLFVRSFIW